MISDVDIEKYKMLISIMPKAKATEAVEKLKDAIEKGTESSKALPEINKLVMQNANVCIIKDEKELEGKDLTKYGAVIFDCDIKDVTDFSNCPKKMIFNKSIDWSGRDFEKLPDISESLVCETLNCRGCKNLTSLEGAPKYVGEFDLNDCSELKSFKGAPQKVDKSELKSLEGFPEKVGDNFNYSNKAQEVKATDTKVNLVNLKKFGGDGR